MPESSGGGYEFLLDTYETELLKIVGTWAAFPASALDYRPHAKSRSVIEQMEHQVQSEGRWMKTMLEIDTGDPNPAERSAAARVPLREVVAEPSAEVARCDFDRCEL